MVQTPGESTSIFVFSFLFAVFLVLTDLPAEDTADSISRVARTKGLIAFWDFSMQQDDRWISHFDPDVVKRAYPVSLRRIGDEKSYTQKTWPYTDEKSALLIDHSGPFGHAVRFNQGYVFAEVPRSEFDNTPLDVHGNQAFTLIAWAKFIGRRHLVAGIWDEGGWNKYGGRRQIALFGGLFGSNGVIGHISTTGASSYPQSTISGSQYARCRAIDGKGFANNQWVAMAMTFDPGTQLLTVYCDGVATPTRIADSVAKDVLRDEEPGVSNPYHFPWAIYSPRAFTIKFNGYDVASSGAYEHWLEVDTVGNVVKYDRHDNAAANSPSAYRVSFDVQRSDASLLPEPIVFAAESGKSIELPDDLRMQPGDQIVTSLETRRDNAWEQVGTTIRYRLREGAPFTFGRALGLGGEAIEHGTQLYLDGVAVFNRVLEPEELKTLTFE